MPVDVASDGSTLIRPIEVVLEGGLRSSLCTSDGRFVFHDVNPGRYTLDVHSALYLFSQVFFI